MPLTKEQLEVFYRSLLPTAYPADRGAPRTGHTSSASSLSGAQAISKADRSPWVILAPDLIPRLVDHIRPTLDDYLQQFGTPTLTLTYLRRFAEKDIDYSNESAVDTQLIRLNDVLIELAEIVDSQLQSASPRELRSDRHSSIAGVEGRPFTPDDSIVETSTASGVQQVRIVFENKHTLADSPNGLLSRLDRLLKETGYLDINIDCPSTPVKSVVEKIAASAQRAHTPHFVLFCGRSWMVGQNVALGEDGKAGFDVLLSPLTALIQPQQLSSDEDIRRSFMLVLLCCLYNDLVFAPGQYDVLLQEMRDDLLASYHDKHVAWKQEAKLRKPDPPDEDDSQPRKRSKADPTSSRPHPTNVDESQAPFTRSRSSTAQTASTSSTQRGSLSQDMAGARLSHANGLGCTPGREPLFLTVLDSVHMPVHPAWVQMGLVEGTLSPFADPDYMPRNFRAVQAPILRSLSPHPDRPPSQDTSPSPLSPDSALYTPPDTPPKAVRYLRRLQQQLQRQYIQASYPTPHSVQVIYTGPYGLGLVDEMTARTDFVVKLARKRPAGAPVQPGDLEHELKIMTGTMRDNASDVVPLVAAFVQTSDLGGREPYLGLVYEYRGKAPLSWSDLTIKIRLDLFLSLLRIHQQFSILHNDVEPRNAVVDEAGKARWIDFGHAIAGHVCSGRQCPEIRTTLDQMELSECGEALIEAAAENELFF